MSTWVPVHLGQHVLPEVRVLALESEQTARAQVLGLEEVLRCCCRVFTAVDIHRVSTRTASIGTSAIITSGTSTGGGGGSGGGCSGAAVPRPDQIFLTSRLLC